MGLGGDIVVFVSLNGRLLVALGELVQHDEFSVIGLNHNFGRIAFHALLARPFPRGNRVATRMPEVAQIGLGLAFCKMAIEAHCGIITIEDNYPNGSIFTVFIR